MFVVFYHRCGTNKAHTSLTLRFSSDKTTCPYNPRTKLSNQACFNQSLSISVDESLYFYKHQCRGRNFSTKPHLSNQQLLS